ncbi:zf-HC2 domain-containing protein [Kitasatospora sp. NPDC050463]|uniref:zf-HC2 domain-containing protein n=1 Tax=Kitasatospora sp. NPDC050463 TaxID=3155786 RepID=UPI0033C40710
MTAPLSSPDPVGAHPSVDELADLAEDLVEPATAEELRRHLDGCADCRGTAEALAEIGTLLGEVPAPAMPADVAARLDAALAAAAGADATDRATSGPTAPQGPHRGTTSPGPLRGPTSAAHSATAPPGPPGRPVGAASSPAGPGRPRPRRRRVAVLLGAAAALLAVGLGGALLVQPADRQGADTAVRAGAPAAAGAPSSGATAGAKAELSAGTVYQDDRLAAQVQQLLTRADATPDGPAKPFSPSAAPPVESGQGLTGGGTDPACPAPVDGPLLATDRGSYAGSPVELLVYAVPGRPDQLDVYLRSPDCGPVRLHRTVPAR